MKNVAILADWEYLRIGIVNNPKIPEIKTFVEEIYGTVIFSRFYIPDISVNEKISIAIERLGLTTYKFPKIKAYGKNGTDCDGFLIWQLAVMPYEFPHISIIVILCGDGHLVHAVRKLREKGKQVILIAPKNSVNFILKQNCDAYHNYYQIVSGKYNTSDSNEASLQKGGSSDNEVRTNNNWVQNLFSGKGELKLYDNLDASEKDAVEEES